MNYNLGRVLPIFRGTYDNTTQYTNLDVVYFNGSSYVATGDTVGNAPTDTEHWVPVAMAGTLSPEQVEAIQQEVIAYVQAQGYVIDANYVHTDNNYTNAEKSKLDGIDMSTKQDTLVSGQNIATINGNNLLEGGNIVIQTGGGTTDYSDLTNKPSINDTTLEGNVNLATPEQLDAKQDTLVSGTNIKTINGESILGNGNITIQGGEGGGTVIDSLDSTSATSALSANQGRVLDIKYKYPFLNLQIVQGYVNTNNNYRAPTNSETIYSVFTKVNKGDVIRIYGTGGTSNYYKLYGFYGDPVNGLYPKISVYTGTELNFRTTPLDVVIPEGVSYIGVNLYHFDDSVDCVLKFSINKPVDIDVINDKLNALDATSTINKYKLIELSKWGSTFTLELGQYGYKTNTKELRYFKGYNYDSSGNATANIITIPFEAGGLYRYNLTLYYWDATNETMVALNSGGETVSNLEGLSDVNIDSPTEGQALVYDAASSKWKNSSVSGGTGVVVDNLDSTSTTSALSANQGRILNEKDSETITTAYTQKYISTNRTITDLHLENSNTLATNYIKVEAGDIVKIYGMASNANYYRFYALCSALNSNDVYPIVDKYSGANNTDYRTTPLTIIVPDGIKLIVVNYAQYDAATDKIIVWKNGTKKINDERINRGSFGKYYASVGNRIYYKTCEGLYAAYDELMNLFPNFITKNDLGVITIDETESYHMYEYVLSDGNYNRAGVRGTRDTEIAKPIYGIVTGIHGSERSSVNGLYYIIKDMLSNASPLSPIYGGMELHIVPIGCPWAFQHNSRTNQNGVNINRNFGTSSWSETGTGTGDYSGTSAASEPETQILQTWINTLHTNGCTFIFDWHNSGYSSEISCMVSNTNNNDILAIKDKYVKSANSLAPILMNTYGAKNTCIWGYCGHGTSQGMAVKYMDEQGQNGCYFETSNKVNTVNSYQLNDANIGATVMGNVLVELL